LSKCEICAKEIPDYEKYCDSCWEIVGPQKKKAKDQRWRGFRGLQGSSLATNETRKFRLFRFFSEEIWIKDYWLNVCIVSLIAVSILMMVISYAYPWTQAVDKYTGEITANRYIVFQWGYPSYGGTLFSLLFAFFLSLTLLFSVRGRAINRAFSRLSRDLELSFYQTLEFLRFGGLAYVTCIVYFNGLLVRMAYPYERGISAARGFPVHVAAKVFYAASWVLCACFILVLVKWICVITRFLIAGKAVNHLQTPTK